MTNDDLLSEAVLDNAAWCVGVWRSHGLAVERRLGLVACVGEPPRFYPNAVAIDADADPDAQAAWLTELAARTPGSMSIKDSFAALDLAPAGFTRLFDADWIGRPAMSGRGGVAAPWEWRLIESEAELTDWEVAWAGPAAAGAPRVFRPELLADRGVGFLAGYRRGELLAGCILTPTGGVVGIGNVFGPYEAAVDIAATMFPDRTIVGYEQGEDLRRAMDCGFHRLGRLTVWSRAGSPSNISDNLS